MLSASATLIEEINLAIRTKSDLNTSATGETYVARAIKRNDAKAIDLLTEHKVIISAEDIQLAERLKLEAGEALREQVSSMGTKEAKSGVEEPLSAEARVQKARLALREVRYENAGAILRKLSLARQNVEHSPTVVSTSPSSYVPSGRLPRSRTTFSKHYVVPTGSDSHTRFPADNLLRSATMVAQTRQSLASLTQKFTSIASRYLSRTIPVTTAPPRAATERTALLSARVS